MKRSALISVMAAALAALTACGSDEPAAGGGGSGDEGGGTTAITVGSLPVPDAAAVHVGIDQGFFAEEGLDVTVQATTGGAAAVPGVVSGTYAFAFGNFMSGMVAQDQGLDIRYVTHAAAATETGGFQAVVVPQDSPIQTPADLAGKRVSVNNFANINDTTIRGIVDADGGDSSQIQFVEVPFPDAEAAVVNRDVDAATLNPWTEGMASDLRVVTYNFTDFVPDLDIAGWFTTAETIEEDPELVESFQAAMNRSLEFSQENPDEVRRVIGTYTQLPPEVIEELTLPVYRTEVNREALTALGAAAVEYGTLEAEPDLDRLLW
jgi:NitT/TauT family transport system substrate-binding protein